MKPICAAWNWVVLFRKGSFGGLRFFSWIVWEGWRWQRGLMLAETVAIVLRLRARPLQKFITWPWKVCLNSSSKIRLKLNEGSSIYSEVREVSGRSPRIFPNIIVVSNFKLSYPVKIVPCRARPSLDFNRHNKIAYKDFEGPRSPNKLHIKWGIQDNAIIQIKYWTRAHLLYLSFWRSQKSNSKGLLQ